MKEFKCKDCIHYCVCKDTVTEDNWTDDTPIEIREIFSPKYCDYFFLATDVAPIVRPIFDVAAHLISHAPAVNVITVDDLIEQLAKLDPYIVDGAVMFDLGEWTQWLRDIGAKEGSPLNEHYELGARMDGGNE